MIKVGKAYIIFPAGFNLSKEAHNAYFEQSLLKEKLNEELRTKDARSIIQIHLKYVHAFEKFIKLITLDNISKLSSSEFDSYLYDVTKEVGNLSEAVQYAYSRKDSIGEELFQMLNILD
ncbi:TPA: hypothetical protein EYP70_00240, partial [Candidatus Bathyarchaeota archaeon]|nr:hypothetical protein [Candidatus Bathyarchaeota archaeon]